MTNIPDGVKQPTDHSKAQQAEAEAVEKVTVEFDGQEFTFPADPQDWSAETLMMFEDGKAVKACLLLVGERRWNKLGMNKWSGRKVSELFDLFAKKAGLDDEGE